MNQAYNLYRISQLLSRFREQVKILNSNGEFSINIHAENILIKVLNEIYSCDLENVNYEEGKTYPSIDLRDKAKRIAIQVTSTASIDKIRHTLTKFIETDLHKEFDQIYIYILTEKQGKYDGDKISSIVDGKFVFNTKNIIDRTDIYKELNKQNNLEKINLVCELLEKQFADNKAALDKWNLYCKGLNEYDNYVHNYYKYLDIKGFSPKINNTVVKISLEHLYVPLILTVESEINEYTDDLDKNRTELSLSIEKALTEFKKLVVLGDPGSGKSTLLKHLAYKICTDRPTKSTFSDMVPIIIKGSEFAKFVSSTNKNLAEYIIDHIDKKYEFLFTKKLENNQLLVLVDGIDEINITNLRHAVVDRINAFIAQYPELNIVVSSRIVGYRETRLNGHFQHLQVVKFKEKEIKKFICNWYESIAANTDEDIEKAKSNALELFHSIKRNDSVLNMASNPLLITIIALIHHQGGALPERRASLYDIATSTFLENWVRQRGTHRDSIFDKETLIAILAPISYNIHENFTTGLIAESELKRLFQEEYKKIYPYQKTREEIQDLKELINFLREDAGFLFEKGLNEHGEAVFGFVHQTFQEYFTAIEFKTRWREGYFDNKLGEFVFNPNWNEVIKLTASLFKFSEPTRLGRQCTTDFVKNLLNVDDAIPDMYRPLNLVLQILIENTEIEFDFFVTIIDRIFNDILSVEGDLEGGNRELYVFSTLIEKLIQSKLYQSYLVERIMEEITNKNGNLYLKNSLLKILMHISETSIVNEALTKLLTSKHADIKIALFDYNVVYPISEIVLSKVFRDEIVKYVNSEEFVKKYNGHLPTQYHCAFENARKGSFLRDLSAEKKTALKEDKFLSIRLIQNESIRNDYIDFLVFSIGMEDIDELKDYVSTLQREYPGIALTKIDKKIKEIEKFKAYGLSDNELIEFDSTKIYSADGHDLSFAFVKGGDVTYLKYPFEKMDLKKYFKDKTDTYLLFLDLVIPALMSDTKKIVVPDLDSLLNFIKYDNTLHWSIRFNTENIFCYALTVLFDCSQSQLKSLLNWIKGQQRLWYVNSNSIEDLDKKKFISNLMASKLKVFEKLWLLHLVGEKSDYENLIVPTIEYLNTVDSEKIKNEIKEILYEVL